GPDRPFDLEAELSGEALVGGEIDHLARERALAALVVAAFLGVSVNRCERPAVLRAERGDPVEVGDQSQVAVRATDVLARGDGIVDYEDVEDRGHADAPAGGSFEA